MMVRGLWWVLGRVYPYAAAGDGGETHTVMLNGAGKVFTFGRSAYGRLGLSSVDPNDDEPRSQLGEVGGVPGRAVSVVAGSSTTGCVTESGEAYVWGYGDLGQLAGGRRIHVSLIYSLDLRGREGRLNFHVSLVYSLDF